MTWLYRWLKEAGCYTVGYYDPKGKWEPESDHSTAEAAANRVVFLNGGPVNGYLLAALKRLMDERNPFVSDTENCECGECGDGHDNDGNVCEHIQANRAIAKAEGVK